MYKELIPMATKPAASSELFRTRADSEAQCLYICAPLMMCQALLYSGSECIGFFDHYTDGEALEGAVALRTRGKIDQCPHTLVTPLNVKLVLNVKSAAKC